jgi:hypothetical protein
MSVNELDQQQLERIVVSVISRLMTPAPSSSSATSGSTPFIEEPVITQDLLIGRVNGSRTVRVGPRAILTPSARDFLRVRGIECVRDANSGSASAMAARPRWIALVSKATSTVTSALASLGDGGSSLEQRLVGSAIEAAQQGVGLLCRGDAAGVAVFTDEPEVVACIANRNASARAAVVASVAQVSELQRSLGVNFAAVNPVGMSLFELRNVLRVVTSGIPTTPHSGSF